MSARGSATEGVWVPRGERPLDAADTALGRFAMDLRQLRVTAGNPTYRELAARVNYSVTALSRAAAGRTLPSLAVTLAYVRACGGDPEPWQARWQALAAELTEAAPAAPVNHNMAAADGAAPYVGLAAFQAGDAERFFGRDALVGELLALIGKRRFVGLFGASGSGKSSVLRAGLVARAASGAGARPAVVVTPGPHPIEECAVALAGLTGTSAAVLRTEFAADPMNLHVRVRQALADRPADADLLLVVDQFEELFTLCTDQDERAWLIGALTGAAAAPTSRTRVVIGVRADFYGCCGQYPELVAALRGGQVLVGAMSCEELREAITQPAVRSGCMVEAALLSRLIADAAGQPAVLPLVSHALLETWRRRSGATLTLAGYEATGGIQHAIARTAEQIHTALTPDQQDIARRLFLRLTALGEGTEDTKRRIRRAELDTDDPDTTLVLEYLTQARLLTLDRDTVEITHEALIRCWPRLRDWLAQDREGLRIHRQLTDGTDVWESLDHDPGTLFRGVLLAVTRDWAGANDTALTIRERAFLRASLTADRRHTRRLWQLVALLAVLLLGVSAATAVAFHAQAMATEQRNIALARKAAGDAAAIREWNPALSVQLSLAAYRLAPIGETRDDLLSTFATPYAGRLLGHTGDVVGVGFAAGGRVLASASVDHTVRLWDVGDVHHPRELARLGDDDALRALAVDPRGQLLATATAGTVRLWDLTDPVHPKQLAAISQTDQPVNGLALNPDNHLLAVTRNRTLQLWDIADPRQPRPLATPDKQPDQLGAVAFSPNGQYLAVAGQKGWLWDVRDPVRPRRTGILVGHAGPVAALAFSPDGRTLATGGWDHDVRTWDISDPGNPVGIGRFPGHSAIVSDMAFSPDGHLLATGDGTVHLWDVADRGQLSPLTTMPGGIYAVAFSPDGNVVAASDGRGPVRLQDLRDLPLVGHRNPVASLAFSPDGHTLATGSWDHSTRLWDVTDPHQRRVRAILTAPQQTTVRSVAFSPTGDTLATASDAGYVLLWNVAGVPRITGTLDPYAAEITAMAFHPGGHQLAIGGGDKTVRLLDITDPGHPAEFARLDGFTGTVWAVAFSPDGHTLAASDDSSTRLWDLTDPGKPREWTFPFGRTGTVSAGSFSPDGGTLAMLAPDNSVRLLDIHDPQRPRPLASLTGHTDIVWAVTFSPNGHQLATGSADKTARLWDVTHLDHPKSIATLTGHTADVAAIRFSPNGRFLATGSNDATARLWETDINRVATHICAIADPQISQPDWNHYFPTLPYQPPC